MPNTPITDLYPKPIVYDNQNIVLGAPLLDIAGEYEKLDGLFKRRAENANPMQVGIFTVQQVSSFVDSNYLAVTNGSEIPPTSLLGAADYFEVVPPPTTWQSMTMPVSAGWFAITNDGARSIAVAYTSSAAAYLPNGSENKVIEAPTSPLPVGYSYFVKIS